MYTFYGNYEKHDFILTTAVALSTLKEKPVRILTDNLTHYSHLAGDFRGVEINSQNNSAITIYDLSKSLIKSDKVILCTNHTKNSVESIKSLAGKVEIEGYLVCDQGSRIADDYIEAFTGNSKVVTYSESVIRSLDMIYEGRLDFRKLESSFIKSITEFLITFGGEAKADMKELWTFLGKKG
jgi:hypothetical protein